MGFKTRISVLLLLLVVEIGLLYAFINHGWTSTVTWLIWLQAMAIAGIPIVIIAVLLVHGRTRLSIRALMVIVACVGTFVAISLLPINRAKERRYGVKLLTANGVELEDNNWCKSYFKAIDDPLPPNWTAYSTQRELPGWLVPLAGDATKLPKDSQILTARISSRKQLALLIKNAKRFESLQYVSIYWKEIDEASISKFCNHVADFPNLICLHVGGGVIPEECLPKLSNIRYLSIFGQRIEQPSELLLLSERQLTAISELPSLQVLVISACGLEDQNLEALVPSKSLKMVHLYHESRITQAGVDAFEAAHPGCEVLLN